MVETAEAAASVSRSLAELNLTARDQQALMARESEESDLPQVLARLVSIDWAGPVEPLVKQLAVLSKEPIPEPVIQRPSRIARVDKKPLQSSRPPRLSIRTREELLQSAHSGLLTAYGRETDDSIVID